MVEIHIIILAFLFAVSATIIALGYLYRTSFPMSAMWFISGAIFLIVFLSTDELSIENYIASTETINNNQDIIYNVTSHSSTATVLNVTGASEIRAISVLSNSELINKSFECIEVPLSKTGNPIANLIVAVFDNNGDYIEIIGIMNSSSLTTSFIIYEFCNTFPYQINENDFIGVQLAGGSVGNQVNIRVDSNNPFDGTNTQLDSFVNGVWVDATPSSDVTAQLILNIDNSIETNTIEQITYPLKNVDENGVYTLEPTFLGIALILISISFIMIGVLIERD